VAEIRDSRITSATGVAVSRVPILGARSGSTPSAALQELFVRPIPISIARRLIEREHYLHTFPGGTHLAFGIFVDSRLLGALTLGVGPFNAHSLVEEARPSDCLTLTRFWLADELPRNSESRVLGLILRHLKRHTDLKFLITYADPSQGHLGTIYQATGWTYTGLSQANPLYDLGDGKVHHSRSLSHAYGSHSLRHFSSCGIDITLVPQVAKHRYIFFLDPNWRSRLNAPAIPFPKREVKDGTP